MKSEDNLEELYTLKIAALLHDIGKPACWAHYGEDIWRKRHTHHGHVYFGEEIISECLGRKGESIALTARRHHKNRRFPEDCPVEDLEQTIHIADILASAADRPEGKLRKFCVRLSHPLSSVDAPHYESPEIGSLDLLEIDQEMKVILRAVAPLIGNRQQKRAYTELYEKLSKSGMTRIPADTRPSKSDHTLWDHSRLTTALATCIYFDGGYKGKDSHLDDYKFAFLAGDTDRVGKFIHQSRRLPDLVARSNIARSAIEAATEKIETVLGRECVIYEGGGNFLALCPLSKADELRDVTQEVFEKKTEGRLSVTVDYFVVNGREFCIIPFWRPCEEKGFNVLWRRTFDKVRTKKRTKIPERLPDVDANRRLCDVCLQEPATVVDSRHPYFINESGVRRRERLCVRCHSLRDTEWKRGVWMDKYADKNTGLVALFKIDGDDVGDIVEGSVLGEKYKKRASPARLSSISRLIDSTCRKLGDVAESKYEGRTIYAAGDDLLGVVRGSQGLECIHDLTDIFCKKMAGQVTMSAGLVIMKADFPVYMALEALEQLLRNAKEYREKSDVFKVEKANIDFEVIYQVGLTKGDFELKSRVAKRGKHLSHRPCKIHDLNEFFKMLDSIISSRVRKNQATFLATVLASQQERELAPSEENVKLASLFVRNFMGRGYIDPETGRFLLESIDNGVLCDAYMLANRVYTKEEMIGA